jgi:hypothetical protein
MEYRAKPQMASPEKDSGSGPSESGRSANPLPELAKHPMMGPEKNTASCPTGEPNGDNPGLGGLSAELPQQGDLRNKDTQRGSNPYPGKPGAA